MLAAVLSWIAVSCEGPIFIKTAGGKHAARERGSRAGIIRPRLRQLLSSAALDHPQTPDLPTSASTPRGAAAPVTTAPVAATSPWNGSEIFVVGAVFVFFTLIVSMYVFRAKPE